MASSAIKTEQIGFQPPKECLVLNPTEEEFKSAPAYICKIRPIAEEYGIVKIIPPKSWTPPFTLDVSNCHFTPIVQRLHHMDAITRLKLDFVGKLEKFWKLQGILMEIPLVRNIRLDLYSLNRIVQEFGGYEQTSILGKWTTVAKLMNFPATKAYGLPLKIHYKKLIRPYYSIKQEVDPENTPSTSTCIQTDDVENAEFEDKHVFPKFPKFKCYICNRTDREESMIICADCHEDYHTFCLKPRMKGVQKKNWSCPRCIHQLNNSTIQDLAKYTLSEFGERADYFKEEYFRRPRHQVTTETVEQEFWRIVSSKHDDDVVVEYGTDLNTNTADGIGTGFPIKNSSKLRPGDMKYVDSSWNLNNLPTMEESTLSYITDITGTSDLKTPFVHVGMCFSTFNWDVEEHWTYSINYLHWGEPTTWYGVPSSQAEKFEGVLNNNPPQGLKKNNWLHRPVSILNPNILMQNGIPVYRTDQKAGEFVITFPRAYHAGFNQGRNFAESVNFAPADWLRMTRNCVRDYSKLHRSGVFSHDELICKMVLVQEKLSAEMVSECYIQFTEMLGSENELRKIVQEQGTINMEHRAFEIIANDERRCQVCGTICFLSAVSCSCTNQIRCLHHHSELCKCNPNERCLLYRYTKSETSCMAFRLVLGLRNYEGWLGKCRAVVIPQKWRNKLSLESLQELVYEAKREKYPKSILLDRLTSGVTAAQKCIKIIQMLDLNKVITRTNSTKYKLNIPELEMFVEEIDNLLCTIKESISVRELLASSKNFVTASNELLSKKVSKVDEKSIEKLIDKGSLLSVQISEIDDLRDRLEQVNWYKRSHRFHNAGIKFQPSELNRFIKEGMNLMPEPIIEKEIIGLQNIEISIQSWEIATKACLDENCELDLCEIEWILGAADKIQTDVPSKATLKEALKRAKDWLNSIDILQKNEFHPYYDSLKEICNKAITIPLKLDNYSSFNEYLHEADQWKEQISKMFLHKRSQFTLLDVLSPRTSAFKTENSIRTPLEELFSNNLSPAQIVDAFKKAEEKEIRDMRELRQINTMKSPLEDKFCVCKEKFSGIMYMCQLCLDWFHKGCVRANKGKETATNSQEIVSIKSTKFFCPSCMRSRRPQLAAILPRLVSLNRLPIRLPEGEALQCLTERAMNWQDRTRQVFASEDVAAALAALPMQSKLDVKHSNTIERKTIPSKVGDEGLSDSDLSESDGNEDSTDEESSSTNLSRSDCEDDAHQIHEHATNVVVEQHTTDYVHCVRTEETTENDAASEIEHAYSAPIVPSSSTQTAPVISESPTKSQHSAEPSSSHVGIELKRSTRELLQNLKLEGDLLEVTVEETKKLWKLLNMKSTCFHLTPVAQVCKIFSKTIESKETLLPAIEKETTTVLPLKKRVKTASSDIVSLKRRKSMFIYPNINKGNNNEAAEKTNEVTKNLRPRPSTSNIPKRKRAAKKRTRRNYQQLPGKMAIDEDDEEECRAKNCQNPTDQEVDWVQCDICNCWFHMLCVGLNRGQIMPDDEFKCELCFEVLAK